MTRVEMDEPGSAKPDSGTIPGPNQWKGAWLVLVGGMAASAVLALWFGREVSFTIDEYSWISLSARFGPGEMFAPYVGHLLAIPRLIYWAVLETIGNGDYMVFQALTLVSLFIMIGLLFTWLRGRTGDGVALPLCLVLLVFPVDHLHYLTGNGIAIALALAFGIAALLAWDRDDAIGDIAALVLLSLGALTYTIAIPFAAGLVVAGLIFRKDRHRLWVGAVPLALYGLWRVLEGSGGVRAETGGIEWDNLFLLPAWSFQSLGSILAAMTGLGFDFTNVLGGPAFEQGAVVGPTLASLAILGIAWRWRRSPMPRGFWMTLTILGALLASQVIVWGTLDGRTPGAPRYLLPGAVLVVLVVGEVVRGVRPRRIAIGALWVAAVASLAISTGILITNLDWFETTESAAKAEITAVEILATSRKEPLPPARQPRESIRSEYDARRAGKYGYLGFTPQELGRQEGWVRGRIDRFLAESLGIEMTPAVIGVGARGCRAAVAVADSKPPRVEIPSPGSVIGSSAPVALSLGRYGDRASFPLGTIAAGDARRLLLPYDEGVPVDSRRQEWFVQTRSSQPGTFRDLVLCDLKRPEGRKGR